MLCDLRPREACLPRGQGTLCLPENAPLGTFKEIPTPAVSSALPLEIVGFPIPLAELRHVTIPHHLCLTPGAGYHNTALAWEDE